MANSEHLAILKQGVEAWNEWRRSRSEIAPDLKGADLRGAQLARLSFQLSGGIDLRDARLAGSDLGSAYLFQADLRNADLRGADLGRASLVDANLKGAIFSDAKFLGTNLRGALCDGSVFSRAFFVRADFSSATLEGSEFDGATIGYTAFNDVDLSATRGLEAAVYNFPSSVGIDTIYRSKGKIPRAFLRGCGLRDWEIEAARLYDPALSAEEITDVLYRLANLRSSQPFLYYSCFISYSTHDRSLLTSSTPIYRPKGCAAGLHRTTSKAA